MGANAPTPSDALINSLNVIKRIEELETVKEDYEDERAHLELRIKEIQDELFSDESKYGDRDEEDARITHLEELLEDYKVDLELLFSFDECDQNELDDLLDLQHQAECYCAWRQGATLIHVDSFVDYARRYAFDAGYYAGEAKWPMNHIDWKAAAVELEREYTLVMFADEGYLVR